MKKMLLLTLILVGCGKQVTKETITNVPVRSDQDLTYFIDRDEVCELLFTVIVDGSREATCLDDRVRKSVNLTPNVITQLNTIVAIEDKADRNKAYSVWRQMIK